ncbi:hypothetical protein AB1339_16980 [Streptomyces cyaneofuscatus]|uniref:hypothetical protein n=1 Tax=Streptomyces cyaneofuscatus TaxID=66883 RepID=UPI00345E051E
MPGLPAGEGADPAVVVTTHEALRARRQAADKVRQFLDRQAGGGGVYRFFSGVLVVRWAVEQGHEVADVADRAQCGRGVDSLVGAVDGLRGLGELGHEFGDIIHRTLDGGHTYGLTGSLVALGNLLQQLDQFEDLIQRPGGGGGVHQSVDRVGGSRTSIEVRIRLGAGTWPGLCDAVGLSRGPGLSLRSAPGIEGLDRVIRRADRPYHHGVILLPGGRYRSGSAFGGYRHDGLPILICPSPAARGGHMRPEPSYGPRTGAVSGRRPPGWRREVADHLSLPPRPPRRIGRAGVVGGGVQVAIIMR